MELHRMDGVNGADEHQVPLYEYDGRNLVTKVVNAAGGNTLYVYDGNGNMISKTDADGYVTEYSYNSLDLVSHISYNGAKEVSYQHNKVGEIVAALAEPVVAALAESVAVERKGVHL